MKPAGAMDLRRGHQDGARTAARQPRFPVPHRARSEGIAPNSSYKVNNLELASRLSFFLWSSIPDEELIDVASKGKLSDPAVLEKQVRRMLADSRAAKSFVDNFGGQWLLLRNLAAVTPDSMAYPDFDDNLRVAFQQETELFLEYGLREDRSIASCCLPITRSRTSGWPGTTASRTSTATAFGRWRSTPTSAAVCSDRAVFSP